MKPGTSPDAHRAVRASRHFLGTVNTHREITFSQWTEQDFPELTVASAQLALNQIDRL